MSETFHHMIDDLPSPVFYLTGEAGHVAWANTAAQELTARSLSRMNGRPLIDFLENVEGFNEAYKRCYDGARSMRMRDIALVAAGHARKKYHIILFPTQDGVGVEIQAAHTPPNDRHATGDAMSAMGRMLAHEIKNPLAGINGAAQLLLDDITSDEGRVLIELIQSEIERIRRLADRMEKLGDRNPESDVPVNIHEVLRRARRIIQAATADNIVFTEKYDPSLPSVFGDADTLMQAILNLIKNAAESLQSSGEGGEITLQTSFRSGVHRRVDGARHGGQLPIEIQIVDDGPGLPDDLRGKVFQPFVSSKPSGQGLGLAMVSKVAEAHGGLIEVTSRPEQTIFSLLLPMRHEDV